jgi:hypothetical protein
MQIIILVYSFLKKRTKQGFSGHIVYSKKNESPMLYKKKEQ